MKFIVNSSCLETDFSKLKGFVAFLDRIKNFEISIEEVRYKQEEFNRYLKTRFGNKSENKQKKNHWLISIRFLMEETMLLNF